MGTYAQRHARRSPPARVIALTTAYLPTTDLVAELAVHAAPDGASTGMWPGLTFYRFTEPTELQWDRVKSLSVGIVARRPAAASVDERPATFGCMAIGPRPDGDPPTLDASPDRPCLGFVLEVEPPLIHKLASHLRRCDMPRQSSDEDRMSTRDDELLSSIVRFLRSLSVAPDRRVLTPLHLQEMVYRVLQREQYAHLVRLADPQTTTDPIATAVDYISEHLAERLTVEDLARQANLSPSAFSRLFRDATGCSPYQFVKAKRLIRAQELLDEGRLGVTDVARNVGYPSLSHFIKEFRTRFGATPGGYVDAHTYRGSVQAYRANAAG